ncbi:hypothetical protein [Pedobacter sp. JY14-1]|uniref:hypothetical protein n=1 Tax=Pedobacter sp. JY14-1 TaxID=3034151 RepID=UPI0023E25115|nr:hypothetical protein [Pedobacter sp. JY14-1]
MRIVLIFSALIMSGLVLSAQTLQTVVNNGNTVTTAVRLHGRVDLGEKYDAGAYGSVQIARAANQGNKFHLSFISEGQMVYGMGYLNNSTVFGIQPGSDNSTANGIFIAPAGNVGLGNQSPQYKLDVSGDFRVQSGSNLFAYNGLADVLLKFAGRGSGGRAMVHDTNNRLTLNCEGDFTGGTSIGTNVYFSEVPSGTSYIQFGNVGIGTTNTQGYKLAVAGNMIAESVKVKLKGAWPDYVFTKDYKLPTLAETETHIKEKGYLPGIPSAAEVTENGVELGEMNKKLLQKIEELTLHLISKEKEINELKKSVRRQESAINMIMSKYKFKQ